jgi:hypothetical protein
MVNPRGLIGLGMPAQLAKRIGVPSSTGEANLSAAGTTQATAQAIGQFQFYVRSIGITTSAIGLILPTNAEIGSEYIVVNTTTSCVVWPPVNGQLLISGGVTATGVSIAVGKGALFIAITASTFDTFLTA